MPINLRLDIRMIFENISLDQTQQNLVEILESIATRVRARYKTNSIFSSIRKFVSKSTIRDKNNIYIHGGVGRGKTMIMREFFRDLPNPKLLIHYQDFMKMVHEDVHSSKGSATQDVLVNISKRIAKKYKYICIDELEVNDIADAMIIGRIFEYMMRYGLGLAVTSNVRPDELYKNGLQREQFLPFIDIIKNKFIVFPLETNHDYRLDRIWSIENRVLSPLSKNVEEQMLDVKNKLTAGGDYKSRTLEVFGRDLVLPFAHKSVLVTNFDDLCRQNLSSNDFIAIAKHFNIIIMENIPIINEDETDVIIRFINFIDNLYFQKVLLFISLEVSPEQIYPKGKRVAEFQRTVSRLYEINSHEYLVQSQGG